MESNSQSLDQNLNDIYYNYNKAIIEYYKTFQRIVDLQMHNTSNRVSSSMEMEQNMMYYMNLNIQSFHTLTKQLIERITDNIGTIRDIRQPTNRSTPTTASTWIPPSNTRPPMNRPQTSVMFPVRPETPYQIPVTTGARNTYPTRIDLTNAFTRAYRVNQPESQGLSRRQITEFTQDFIWTQVETDEAADASGNVCPISLERFSVGNQITRIRACNHKFKRPFLLRWLERDRRCPVCRHDVTVLPEEPNQEPTQEDQELEPEPEITPDTTEPHRETSTFGPNTEDLIERFLTNELNQIINDDVANILREMTGNIDSRVSTTEIETPLGTIEISREVVPIDIEYRVHNTQEEKEENS